MLTFLDMLDIFGDTFVDFVPFFWGGGGGFGDLFRGNSFLGVLFFVDFW